MRAELSDQRTELLGLAIWVTLLAAGIAVGAAFVTDTGVGLDAAPFVGDWNWHLTPAIVPAVALAAAVVVVGPSAARRLPFIYVAPLSGITGAVWATLLAASEGWSRLSEPLATPYEYEPFAATITDAGDFLRGFVEQVPSIPAVHVQGHPPGITLVPWALDQVGLDGAGWFAALTLVGWAVAVAAVLVAARLVAGEEAARRAAPAVVLVPGVLWAATSADALFAGVFALGVLLAIAGGRPLAAIGGAVLGFALLLTYGGILLLGIPVAVHLRRRRLDLVVCTGLSALGVLLAVGVATGFWWHEGLEATRTAYWAGVASDRPTAYLTLLGNPSAFAAAVGPAVAAGLATAVRHWRDPRWFLPLIAVGLVGLADASLLSKGEVERIWLIFVPWLALAAPGNRRWWLGAQAATAIVLQILLRSTW